MNYTGHHKLKVLPRNEGKIKSYESCNDVRAWSHDLQLRDRHLREWMKCDMPICVIPISTLASFLRNMTCRSRGKTTPRCHPDCKSKALLESICNSCHAMKECFKNDENFDKYFDEEEFETSHWPCEKCLEALKSIKMFWRIIIEKIFNINLTKNVEFEHINCSRTTSVRSVAKIWQNDMVQQALYVKSITPLFKNPSLTRTSCSCKQNVYTRKEMPSRIPKLCRLDNSGVSMCSYKINKVRSPNNSIKSVRVKATDTDGIKFNKSYDVMPRRKISRCLSVKVKTVDVACETCNLEKEHEELKAYKNNLDILQKSFNTQKNEVERLKKENTSLRIELQNVYTSCPWKSTFYAPSNISDSKNVNLIPKPFENCIEEHTNTPKNIDSEMIITMKNCKNESFKHVSLLQVLHKTNDPISNDLVRNEKCCQKENPIDLLTKVQNTFGAIVKREINIVNDRNNRAKKSDIDATFQKVNVSKSAPSCSTISSRLTSSESNFVSTKE